MKRHFLYEISLEQKTAFCTACGYTEICVPNTRTRTTPRVICINRARELWLDKQAKQERIREEKRQQPDWKPRHTLTEINAETLRATCAVCGRTDTRRVIQGKYERYECLTLKRGYMRKYRREHYVARSTNPHALSQIDEKNKTAVCAKCGLVPIEIWHGTKKIIRRCINAGNELNKAQSNKVVEQNKNMKNSNWIFYAVVAGLFLVYVVGEATGLLFVAMLIILPVWVWLLTEPDKGK